MLMLSLDSIVSHTLYTAHNHSDTCTNLELKVEVLEPKMERLQMLIPLFQKMFDECFDLDESAITNKSDLSEAQQQFRKELMKTYDRSTDGMHSPVCVGFDQHVRLHQCGHVA
jgi:hypothetical protein